jgi:hypothetical protein
MDSVIEIFSYPRGLICERLVKADSGDVPGVNFKIIFFDSLSAAKIDIKGHQCPAQAFLTMPGMNAEIQEFGFFFDLSKADKTDGVPFLVAIFPKQEEAMGEGVGHLSKKHIFGPTVQGGCGGNGNHLIHIFDFHFFNRQDSRPHHVLDLSVL